MRSSQWAIGDNSEDRLDGRDVIFVEDGCSMAARGGDVLPYMSATGTKTDFADAHV